MILFFIPIGLAFPLLAGYFLVAGAEGRTRVLGMTERIALAFLLGTLLTAYLAFLGYITLGIPFTRGGFLGVQIVFVIVSMGFWYWQRSKRIMNNELGIMSKKRFMLHNSYFIIQWRAWRWYHWLLALLLVLSFIKIAIAAATFLVATPSYLDDTLDNWNLRGKVFYETQALSLVMPGEEPLRSVKDVSSYPPTVPLLKAMLAGIAGQWHEGLVNLPHVLWYIAAIMLLFGALAAVTSRSWAWLGVYVYISLPLAFIHGTNTYADTFLAAHLIAAMGLLWRALREEDANRRRALWRIAGLAVAVLPFTKNEAMILYLPPILAIAILGMVLRRRPSFDRAQDDTGRPALVLFLSLAFVLLPWLAFKFATGMSFGNAKPLGSVGLSFHADALHAIFINTFFEANWLLLPVTGIMLLVWQWKGALSRELLPLTVFLLITIVAQVGIFTLTGLATEAVHQTGYARGLVHLAPLGVLLTVLLLRHTVNEQTG